MEIKKHAAACLTAAAAATGVIQRRAAKAILYLSYTIVDKMTKEQFVAVCERLAWFGLVVATSHGWIPVSAESDVLVAVAAGSSTLWGWVKNSRLGKIKAVEAMPGVAAVVVNEKGSDLASPLKTGRKVVNGESAKKIMEIVEVVREDGRKYEAHK